MRSTPISRNRSGLSCSCSIVSCAPSSEDGGSRSFQEQFKAAEQGDAKSQYGLGNMYADGEGVPQNDAEAYTWFAVAAANGHEHAKAYLVLVKGRLNQDQLAAARERATQLFEKINTKKK